MCLSLQTGFLFSFEHHLLVLVDRVWAFKPQVLVRAAHRAKKGVLYVESEYTVKCNLYPNVHVQYFAHLRCQRRLQRDILQKISFDGPQSQCADVYLILFVHHKGPSSRLYSLSENPPGHTQLPTMKSSCIVYYYCCCQSWHH